MTVELTPVCSAPVCYWQTCAKNTTLEAMVICLETNLVKTWVAARIINYVGLNLFWWFSTFGISHTLTKFWNLGWRFLFYFCVLHGFGLHMRRRNNCWFCINFLSLAFSTLRIRHISTNTWTIGQCFLFPFMVCVALVRRWRESNWLCNSFFNLAHFTLDICYMLTDIWTPGWCFLVSCCVLLSSGLHMCLREKSWFDKFHFALALYTFITSYMLTDIRTLGHCIFVWFRELQNFRSAYALARD